MKFSTFYMNSENKTKEKYDDTPYLEAGQRSCALVLIQKGCR